MKEFKDLVITGDILSVICVDTESKVETVEFELDLKPFYFNSNQDLEHNVFSTDLSWIFDDFDDEDEVIQEDASVNGEFMENFCCDVPDAIATALEERGIYVDVAGHEGQGDEHFLKCLFIDDYFEAAIKKALNLDEKWHKKPHDA